MAERDMTGRERSAVDADPTSDAADPTRDLDPELDAGGPSDGLAADLARPRSELSGGIGRLGAPAGLGGDLANLPPWSARDERGRPDRDPAALAAWRRVAERRRLRGGQDAPAVPEPAPAPAVSSPSSSSSEGDAEGEVADTPLAVLGFGPASEELTTDEQPTSDEPTRDGPTAVESEAVEPGAEGPVPEEPLSSPEPVVDEVRGTDVRAHDREVDEGPPDQGSFGVHAPEPRAHDRASEPARTPRERPAGPPPVNGPEGGDRGRREHDGPGGRHEVLLALAGRLDDDALSSVRELVAVEDDAAAAELLGGSLLAADVGLTPRELTVLDTWFSAARVDAELVDALRRDPEADRRLEHRFVADPPSGTAATVNDGPGEVIARAASRLTGVRHVRQCWRTTPAGASPGPVPHRVVLVETHGADDCEHVAHHVAHAARELGAVSVEVFATDAELPPYHRAAVASARPLGSAAAPSAGPARAPRPTMPSGVMPVLPARLRTITGGPGSTAHEAPTSVPPFGVAPGGGGRVSDRPGTAGEGIGSDEEFRTVADAGRTSSPEARPAERDGSGHDVVPDLAPDLPNEVPDDEPIDQLLDDQLGDDELRAAQPRSDDREPGFRERDLEQERPDLVDLDPETTAERIAALWRRPVGEGDTADETESSVVAPSPLPGRDTDDRPRYRPAFPEADPYAPDLSASDLSASDPSAADHAGADPLDVRGESHRGAPSAQVPQGIGEVAPWSSASPWTGPHPDDVDPAAPTGDLSVGDLRAEERRPTSVNGHHLADHAPDDAPHHAPYDGRGDDRPDPLYDGHDADPGRVPRARHSRGGQDGTGPDPWAGGAPPAPEPHRGPPDRPEVPAASGTNGHRHAPDVESSVDPATEPVTFPAEAAPSGPRAWPDPGPTPEPTAAETTGPAEAVPTAGGPPRPSYDDSVDSQLSERERELLARLHDELASRERLEAGTPDPLLGRRGPGDDGAPGGPPPGHRPGPGMPPGPPPGRANGHGLPPRPDPYPEDD